MKIINNPLSYLNLLCTLFLTLRMQEIFLCLSKVNIRVASWSALLCSLYHLLVTTATALELLLPHPMEGPGLLVSPELRGRLPLAAHALQSRGRLSAAPEGSPMCAGLVARQLVRSDETGDAVWTRLHVCMLGTPSSTCRTSSSICLRT